jgi:hypothetical protein
MTDLERARPAHRASATAMLVAAGVAIVFVALGGCVSAGTPSGAPPTSVTRGAPATPSPGPASVPASTPPATPAPAPTRVATPAPKPTPAPSSGRVGGSSLIVTQADNGTTLHLVVGQQFLLDLGSSVDWAVTVADQGVVARVPGVLVIVGAQGIYAARATGTTTLSAIGSPHCTSGACPQYRIAFHLTITVG